LNATVGVLNLPAELVVARQEMLKVSGDAGSSGLSGNIAS
jgi:hypothetical protein